MALIVALKILRVNCYQNCCRFQKYYAQKNAYSTTKLLCKNDEPIPYSKTKASKMTMDDIFSSDKDRLPPIIEKTVILGSLIIFFTYFIFFRKRNKLDEILDGTFNYEEDDEIKLVNALLHAKLKGLKTEEIEKKLKEVRAAKK